MIAAVPKETLAGETRVALTPDLVADVKKLGLEVMVETGAGAGSFASDTQYMDAGATIAKTADELYEKAGMILKVQKPTDAEIARIKPGTILICFLWALSDPELVEKLKKAKVTALGMEAIPRITRAQSMDALSSMSSLAGYKSVLIGAANLGKYLPMMMTAAGTIRPSKVLILGAGVAGLQAIATARRLGAMVEAFDVRPAVKEQVESLGARFVDVPLDDDTETKGGYAKELSKDAQDRQREVIHKHVKAADVVISTALIPGKKAPTLITKAMVEDMVAGSVIVDLAAEQGGNCEYTKAGEVVDVKGVSVHGPVNLPASMSIHASQMYARNILALLKNMVKEGEPFFDMNDEITLYTTITRDGEIVSPLLKPTMEA
jgi:NAD(P) transhydrogenase subunit alpha